MSCWSLIKYYHIYNDKLNVKEIVRYLDAVYLDPQVLSQNDTIIFQWQASRVWHLFCCNIPWYTD